MTYRNERPGIYDLNAYDYELPESLIAQSPAVPRDSARLLAWRVFGELSKVEHRVFSDIVDYLRPDDLLVLNDTRVLPARLYGTRVTDSNKSSKKSRVEILLLNPVLSDFALWRALVRPGRYLRMGAGVEVGGRVITIVGEEDDGVRVVQVGTDREDVLSFMDRHGTVPLPPYIKTDPGTARQDYQTVYALHDGSVAAPTAGLHFTKELLKRLEERGVEVAHVTLHVGLGTFRPVKSLDIRQHHIHSEYCQVSDATEAAIQRCRARGGRVVAVGTTVVRTLESMAAGEGMVRAGVMDTELFIYPGFHYKVVDALITNFHLPKSSLLMLVSAFVNHLEGGRKEEAALDSFLKIYDLAVSERYRFFSFGDAMFIEK